MATTELAAPFGLSPSGGIAVFSTPSDQVQAHLTALVSTQLFRAMLPRILTSPADQRALLVAELKTALQRYLEPLLG